jgi:hypothetical protein
MVAVVANLLERRPTMIKKKILDKARIRSIDGGFAFVPHRFLTGGFLAALDPDQLLLYFFLVLAADRYGLSFYSYDKICSLLEMGLEQYVQARFALISQDLIAFDGTVFQVLALPPAPKQPRSRSGSPFGRLAAGILKEVGP